MLFRGTDQLTWVIGKLYHHKYFSLLIRNITGDDKCRAIQDRTHNKWEKRSQNVHLSDLHEELMAKKIAEKRNDTTVKCGEARKSKWVTNFSLSFPFSKLYEKLIWVLFQTTSKTQAFHKSWTIYICKDIHAAKVASHAIPYWIHLHIHTVLSNPLIRNISKTPFSLTSALHRPTATPPTTQ